MTRAAGDRRSYYLPEPDDLVARVQAELLASYPDLIPAGSSVDADARGRLQSAIRTILTANRWGAGGSAREALVTKLLDEVSGYGPITPLLADETVDEIMVNGPATIYVEKAGRLQLTDVTFRDDDHVMAVISRIVAPLGRRVDRSSPHVDGRLPDGSRVHVILPPLSLQGPVVTIRKFRPIAFTLGELAQAGTICAAAAEFLELAIGARLNAVVAGGAGAGKTTTLNAMAALVDDAGERIITMEDAAELRLPGRHVVRLEARPPNLEGRGEVTMRQLLRNALRMRPDRLIIGEVRGEEAFDLLQALNTGHDGCLSTVHASGAEDALRRIEGMVLTAGHGMCLESVSRQLDRVLDLVLFQTRLPGGRRLVAEVCLAARGETDGLWPLFTVAGRGALSESVPADRGLPEWFSRRLHALDLELPPLVAAMVRAAPRGAARSWGR